MEWFMGIWPWMGLGAAVVLLIILFATDWMRSDTCLLYTSKMCIRDRLMEEQGYPEPTGMAKVTSAFNLPSRRIIHTVGPIARGKASDLDRALLANCYAACLDAALEAGCESIALCCISTGVFGFPQDEAAHIAVATRCV